MIDVALAASDAYLDLSPDDRLLRSALEQRGLSTAVTSWTFEEYDWSEVRCCLPRNTWDYAERVDEFRHWIGRVAEQTRLWNPAPILRWNLHKGYLLELERAGLAITPTALVRQGERIDLAQELSERGWGTFVLRPAVGGSARESVCFARGETLRGQRHLERLLEREDVLLQPFLPSIQTRGEVSIVYLEGGYSHAVCRRQADSGRVPASEGGCLERALPREDEIELATAATAAARARVEMEEELLYARVDILRDARDRPCLSQLELIEPNLYFEWGEGSADRLAGAVFARLMRG